MDQRGPFLLHEFKGWRFFFEGHGGHLDHAQMKLDIVVKHERPTEADFFRVCDMAIDAHGHLVKDRRGRVLHRPRWDRPQESARG